MKTSISIVLVFALPYLVSSIRGLGTGNPVAYQMQQDYKKLKDYKGDTSAFLIENFIAHQKQLS